jgi:CMP-N-acetylneuraminic acid synthetase
MIHKKKILAFVPARMGSKGLPGKNIRSFCGKPLVAYPIEIAKRSQYIDEIIISTNCVEISNVAQKYGANVVVRPEHLATDTALVADAIRDVISKLVQKYDIMVLLEATSPLRTVELVDRCIEQIVEHGVDSIATFSKAETPPTRLWSITGANANPYLGDAIPWKPRQEHQAYYRLNALVYAFDIKQFLDTGSKSIFFGKAEALITEGPAIDIDTLEDFMIAEYIMRTRYENAS